MAEKVVGKPKPVAELAHAQLLAFEVLRRISLARYATPGQLRWMVSTIEPRANIAGSRSFPDSVSYSLRHKRLPDKTAKERSCEEK